MAKAIPLKVVQTGLETSLQEGVKKAGPLVLSATVDPSSFKRLAQPLGRVSGLATEFEKSIAASNARVIAFGASVGIINGVQNAFASLVKTTIEVEKSLTNIAVISGKTVDELQPFSRALFEIAKNTAQSFQTASEAALEFSRQGLSLDETLKRTQDALTLTRFTTLSAAEAVDVLTAAANSFGATGITTSEILNKLVAVDTKFAVSAEDLAKGLSRAGSIAQEVGVNFDELNAIVTIAQERTARGGAVIGNAFKTIFTRIRSDETVRALQSIGIYSFDAQGRLKPVVSLLEELADKIGTLSETKRIEVLEAIASKYNINVLTALVDDLGSTASKFRQARDVSAGAQNEAYQRQIQLNEILDATITKVTNSATQLANTLGKIGVTDSLKSLLNFFDSILTGINNVIDSEGIGGTIAKGLISGLSGVFFKVGIPLLLAIFVKLTRDIAQFGVESLKTILGINKEVRERQALEQAVVNTLIKDQQVMATILSLSGDRAKQERYLLSVYNEQLAALQKVQSIAAGVAPALQAAGLSATSGSIKRRAAEGYLPNAEAKDVRRGVGGASPSSKVVEIPNFSFGGGKRGTMVANTSEYIVPNYAGGSGTAIFNKDMAKEYGLPPGAKKITASGGFVPASGFVPNFAEQKTEEFKKIAPLSVKEIAIKNSRAAREKDAIFENSDKADDYDTFAANIKILRQDKSNTDYNKQSDKILKNDIFDKFNKTNGKIILPEYESLIQRYKDSGVDPKSISRLTTLVNSAQPGDRQAIVNIKSAIKGIEGEIDASKKLKTKIVGGNRYFDLASGEEVKTRATTPASNILKKVANRFLSEKNIKNRRKNNIEEQATVVLPSDGIVSNASRGYIPNFVELNDKGIYAGLVGETAPDNKPDVQSIKRYVTPSEKGLDVKDTGIKSADSVTFDVYRVPKKNEFKLKSIREALGNTGKNLAIDLAREVTGGALGNNVAEQKLTQTFNPGSLQSFANTIFEASVGALLSDKSFQDYTEQSTTSLFDLNIAGNSLIKKNFGIKDSVNALEVKGASTPKLLNSIAEKIYKATAGGQDPFAKRTRVYIEAPGRVNNRKVATAFYKDGVPYVEKEVGVFEPMREGFDASKYELLKNPKTGVIYRGAALGYVPNYVSERAKAAIDRLKKQGATSGEMQAAEAAEARIRGRESAIPRSLLTLDDEKFLETQGGSIEKAMGFGLNPILEKLQSIRNNEELQNSDSTQIKSLKEKIGTVNLQRVWKMIGNQESRRLQVQKTLIEKRYPTRIQGAALGYIPNFADNDPLKEAISREIGAGVSPARVRVTQDGRLKNRDNPNGLAVINTRDEPNGKIPNDFRERGMRAAMAARGFVPNFALTRDNKTKTSSPATPIIQKFEKDISQIPSFLDQASAERFKSAVSSLITNIKALSSNSELLKSKLEEISRDFALTGQQDKAFRSAVKNATQEIENRKNAEKKAWQETNKQVSSFKPSNITTSGGTSQNQPPIIKPQDKKDVDLGKFLILQSAVTGLTSAFQSATEQGSAAANALEGVSAVASGIATFVAIGKSLSPQLRILATGLTALASAFPLLSRLYEDFKSPADRTAEALAKLGKEAEKTGKRISPEEFLSAFDQEQAKRKEEATRKTATKQIQEELTKMGVSINETDLFSLYSIFSASGQINEQGGVDPKAIAALKQAQNPNPSFSERASKITPEQGLNTAALGASFFQSIPFTLLGSILETYITGKIPEYVGNTVLNPLLATQPLNREQVNKGGRQTVLEFQERTRKQVKTVPIDPNALAVENRLLQIKFNVLNSIFESGQAISKQYQQDIATINDQNSALERSRTILTETSYAKRQADLDDKKALAERTKSEQENLQSLRESLRSLQDKGLGNIFSELNLPDIGKLLKGFNPKEVNSEAFRKAFKDVTKTEQNKEGVDLNAVLPADREAIIAALIAATQKTTEITNDYNSKVAEVARNFSNFRSESQKLSTETTFLNAIIAGTSVQLEGAGEAFSGSRKYAELVSLESEKVKNSFAKQVLANKLAETTAYERISGEAQLIESESNLLQAENQSYNENIKNANILALRRSNLLKLEKSERKAEEENQAAIKNITQNYKADIDSTKRKLEYAQALNAQITQAKVNEKVTAEMNLETQNLITSLREARSRLNNVNIATQNEVLKIQQTSANDLTSSIQRGSALSYLGINAEREAQAIAEVQTQRLAGRDANKIGAAELYDISKGRNQTVGQNLKITSASLLDQAESIQDILGKSAPKLFADGMAEAMGATINRAQDLKDVLNDIAMNFLKSLQGKFLSGAANSASALLFRGFSNIGTGGGAADGSTSEDVKLPRKLLLAKGGYIKGYASGGFVTGGSGYKDDVPAMLSQGEYVIRKSSVLKYGADNLQKLNSGEAPKFATGGIFLPGVRGQKEISGYKDLTAFAKQTTTSGATDVLTGGASTAFVNLEDQSQRLSAYALLNQDDTINEEIRTAQEQALNIIKEREAYRTQKRKAFQQQLIGTGISAAVNFGVGYLGNLATRSATSALDKEAAKVVGESGFDYSNFGNNSFQASGKQVPSDLNFGNFSDGAAGVVNPSNLRSTNQSRARPRANKRTFNRLPNYSYPNYPRVIAYGGMIPRFADGGSPRDKVPALLMEGEYVMSDKATRKYGKQFFDSINQGRATRFADGGQVSTSEPSFAEKAAAMSDSKTTGATNVSININVTGQTSQMQTEGDPKQKGADYKEMSKQIEQIVLKTIAEQKRAGGMLKPNR